MPKITIRETDLTTTNVSEEIYNAVYIPGFSNAAVNLAARWDTFVPTVNGVNGVPAGIPKLCTTSEEFKAYFGSTAPTFAEAQSYPVWDTTDGTAGFSGEALAGINTGYMFNAGDPDLSWVMAYELVSNGIPVIYERVNDFTGEPSEHVEHNSSPTTQTAGTVGLFWLNTTITGTDPNLYICTAANSLTGEYTWELYSQQHYTTDSFVAPITVANMYAFLATAYDSVRVDDVTGVAKENPIHDLNEFDIKYVTSGGYPVFEYNRIISGSTDYNAITDAMIDMAANSRKDCIALIDHLNNPIRALTGSDSVYGSINSQNYRVTSDYAAMFTPWFVYGTLKNSSQYMPGSFAYLISLAEAIKSSANWLAVAGVTRGTVPGAVRLNTVDKLTNSIANSYMPTTGGVCINPVTNIKNYGLTIWGNRTLAATQANTEKALYYLNMRSLINEVKKVCFKSSQRLMFEQNSDVLWVNFKSMITPILDEMASSSGISGYKIIKVDTEKKTEVQAVIRLYPIYAVEAFDISIVLTNEDVEVEEA